MSEGKGVERKRGKGGEEHGRGREEKGEGKGREGIAKGKEEGRRPRNREEKRKEDGK